MEMTLSSISTLSGGKLAVKFQADDDEVVFFMSVIVPAVAGETVEALKERAAKAALAKLDSVSFHDEKIRR